jgi:hypothetical protein
VAAEKMTWRERERENKLKVVHFKLFLKAKSR